MIATAKRRYNIRERFAEGARVAPGSAPAVFVGDGPVPMPLATVDDEAPSVLLVLVDGVHARLIPFPAQNGLAEVTLEDLVDRRHRQGGWARLAQTRYQRHRENQGGQHFDAVAEALNALIAARGVEHIVLAGEKRALAGLVARSPRAVTSRVVGTISADHDEPAATLIERSSALLAGAERAVVVDEVAALLTEAAKGGRAVIGLTSVLDAVARGAVRRLYLMKGFEPTGRVCAACGVLRKSGDEPCAACGGPMSPVRLGEAIVERVMVAGGDVDLVDEAVGVSIGGIAARLRDVCGATR